MNGISYRTGGNTMQPPEPVLSRAEWEQSRRTPLQLELGDAEYARLADAWRRASPYALMPAALRYRTLPDTYVEPEDRDVPHDR